MNVLLLHLDGKLPNLALMRLSAWHKAKGDFVELRRADNPRLLGPRLGDPAWGRVYASLIFERTRPAAERVLALYPEAFVGGTGWDAASSLEALGVGEAGLDYSPYPAFRQSIGFTQRGCRLRCPFCVVPRKEGGVREAARIAAGEPVKSLVLDPFSGSGTVELVCNRLGRRAVGLELSAAYCRMAFDRAAQLGLL